MSDLQICPFHVSNWNHTSKNKGDYCKQHYDWKQIYHKQFWLLTLSLKKKKKTPEGFLIGSLQKKKRMKERKEKKRKKHP